jgi:hypothetical protein
VNDTNLYLSLVSAAGMMLVAVAAVVFWRRLTRLRYRWFWVGAALWAIAVAIKFGIAIPTNGPIYKSLSQSFSPAAFVAAGGLYGGVQSSLCEIGLTWLAVLVWRDWGRDADRAIGIGVGAGAFEAFLLGLAAAMVVAAAFSGANEAQNIRQQIDAVADVSPVFWLIATAERIIAILCHASSRALVLLGTFHRRPWMVFWGFVIFTYIDSVATAAHLTGKLGTFSMWWIEFALAPAALISIPILWWCYSRWGEFGKGAFLEVAPISAA